MTVSTYAGRVIAASLVGTVIFVLQVGVLLMAAYALVHAALQRPDAYAATEKLSKQAWLAILGGAALLALLAFGGFLALMGPVIAACAAGVYLADVRPRLLEVQGKSR